ncbi:MAG TPA: monofunctional biosynthetic peptidoglycan transglycosylase [Luteitalea sp.]|nr:monofunctional biosynthetic peptidoglycan transglycosylase [Luteitalea sp.]
MPASPRRRARTSRSRSSFLRQAGRVAAGIAAAGVLSLAYLAVTVPDVRPLATRPPAETAFMRLRAAQAHGEGRPARQDYRFVPYGQIAQTLKRAVLVAEDSGFWDHAGIEMEAIRDSLEVSLAKGHIVRGGSTITQQLAKNLYLSPSQDPFRKLRELMITHRLERMLSKRRILELYLNVSEWGDSTWGAEAASRHYFRKPAAQLGAAEAALLAGALINPNVYNPGHPPPRLRRRQQIILKRMGMRDAPQPPTESDVSAGADATDERPTSPIETPDPPPSSDEQEPVPESPAPDAPPAPPEPVPAPAQPAPAEVPKKPVPTPTLDA